MHLVMRLFCLEQDIIEKFAVHMTGNGVFVFIRDFETLLMLKGFVKSTTLVHT